MGIYGMVALGILALAAVIVIVWMLMRVSGKAFARGWREEMKKENEDG